MHTIFLVYANTPLRGKPQNLLTITRTIDEYLRMANPWHLVGHKDSPPEIAPFALHGEIINWIIYFARKNCDEAQAVLADMTLARPQPELEIAFEAVHGYDDFYCLDDYEEPPEWYVSRCLTLPQRTILVPQIFSERLLCLECEQLYFQAVLRHLAEGELIEDILEVFINQSMFFAPMYDVLNGLTWKTGPDFPEYPYKNVFNNYLRSIIAFCFHDFLTNHDVKLLRICQQCNKFYIAKGGRKQSRFCCDSCRYEWHNKKRIISGELKEYKRKRFGWIGKE